MVMLLPEFTARQLRAVCILAFPFLLGGAGNAYSAEDNTKAASLISKSPTPVNGNAGKSAPKLATKPLWSELTPLQQHVLLPLAAEWDKLDPLRKKKWLEIAQKYATMKPDDQARLQTRMRDWAKLTPEQRRLARESYARAKKLNADQKTARWNQYQQLPDEQKKKLAVDAASTKQVANLPSAKSKGKTVAPIKTAPTHQANPQPPVVIQPAPETAAPPTQSPAPEQSPQPTSK